MIIIGDIFEVKKSYYKYKNKSYCCDGETVLYLKK